MPYKKQILGLIVGLGLVIVLNFDTLNYGFRQAIGQLHIITNTRSVAEVLADKNFPDSLKKRIELIAKIKRFAVDSLGLNPSDNYSTYYDQQGKGIMWVITAADPFAMQAKKWKFPFVGEFSYKGHFDKAIATAEINTLKTQGYDTHLGEASAWSTLGYLKDPILSSMLTIESDGRLAALIIHELTHGTLFKKDSSVFNENLADFVGDYGAIRFLKSYYRDNNAELKKYNYSKKYNDAYSQHIMRGAKKLDSLYRDFSIKTSLPERQQKKQALIAEIVRTSDTLLANGFINSHISKKKRSFNSNNLPNNAYFIGYLTYQSKQNQFKTEFLNKFKANFKNYLVYLKEKYPTIAK